jgi:hypothetical protein
MQMQETKLLDALQLEAGQRPLLHGRVKARFSLDERKGRGAGVPSLRQEMAAKHGANRTHGVAD